MNGESVLYGEVVKGSQTVYFYFSSKENEGKLVYSHEITEL
ncbi:antitoxin YezG family protein [Bacillus pumilus]|nr:antitoxin YezG family protein [Bacillus pumilus]